MATSGARRHRTTAACCAVVVSAALAASLSVAGAGRSATAESTAEIEPPHVTTASPPTTSIPRVEHPVPIEAAATAAALPANSVVAVTAKVTDVEVGDVETIDVETIVEVADVEAIDVETIVEVADVQDNVEAIVEAPSNQSTCRSDLPGATMTIAMPDIAYWCPVYAGGQSVIDEGVATVITAEESSFALASQPGAAGTLWITGHRSSYGGPFGAVPDLADGSIVTVADDNQIAAYVIVGRSYVEVRDGLAVDASGQTTEAATLDAVLRPDRNADLAPRLLLQTCDTENFRWMIYADLVAA